MEVDNGKSMNAIKNDDNMEGKCKKMCKNSQRKEYSYAYFVLRTR